MTALLLVSIIVHADILQIDYLASYTATLPCTSNCTQTFALSFQYDRTSYPLPPGTTTGSIVPGTSITLVRLGSWADSFQNFNASPFYDGTINFDSSLGDQFSLLAGTITPGINTVRGVLWGCVSSGCTS